MYPIKKYFITVAYFYILFKPVKRDVMGKPAKTL